MAYPTYKFGTVVGIADNRMRVQIDPATADEVPVDRFYGFNLDPFAGWIDVHRDFNGPTVAPWVEKCVVFIYTVVLINFDTPDEEVVEVPLGWGEPDEYEALLAVVNRPNPPFRFGIVSRIYGGGTVANIRDLETGKVYTAFLRTFQGNEMPERGALIQYIRNWDAKNKVTVVYWARHKTET